MSQSLHAIVPTPHFGCHFDGHLRFAQQQENEGLNLIREKSVAHVPEYDHKDVKPDIQSPRLQHKGHVGFETKKSLPPEANAEHETHLIDDNNHAAASDDIKPRLLQDVINERRIRQGKEPISDDIYILESNHGPDHCPKCQLSGVHAPITTSARTSLLLRLQKEERDRAENSLRLNRLRLPERPKPRQPIDPQKAKENFYKNRPYMMRSD